MRAIFDFVDNFEKKAPIKFKLFGNYEYSSYPKISIIMPIKIGQKCPDSTTNGQGYLVLEDSVVSYKCGEVFYGVGDSGIMYNDLDMGIVWPVEKIGGIENLIISEKDKNLMSLKEYLEKKK